MSTASYGNYWLKMTKYNERGTCPKCDTPETMQHILFNCDANQSKIIWKIAEKISQRKNIQWPYIYRTWTSLLSWPSHSWSKQPAHTKRRYPPTHNNIRMRLPDLETKIPRHNTRRANTNQRLVRIERGSRLWDRTSVHRVQVKKTQIHSRFIDDSTIRKVRYEWS